VLADKGQSPPQSVDGAFKAASEMQAYKNNLLAFQTILRQLGSDKGLANYDKNNELETVLKDFVNANKNVLTATHQLVESTPTLGPILGPSKSRALS
jgi:hypothetical protein